MNVILLSGGSGKRLWPLSNDVRSKQFLKIFYNKQQALYESMAQRIYRQLERIAGEENITVATAESQVSAIYNQLGKQSHICAEPCRRDTFPAIVLASSYLADKKGVSLDEVVVVCPVDSYVEEDYFDAIKELCEIAKDKGINLSLLGIEPTYPSEKYGYVIPRSNQKISKVLEFKEKPKKEAAADYIARGALWNGGAFAFRLGWLLEKAHERIEFSGYNDLYAKYDTLEKISFDYAIAEKESSIQVLRYSGVWKDIGTWNTLAEAMEEPMIGNVIMDETCDNTQVINELDVPILCMGLKSMIVSASSDGIIVSDKGQSSFIKPYVESIHQKIRYAEKSWGTYRVIDVGEESLTIKATLLPGEKMNYHSHEHRDEVWTVISGTGKAIVDGTEIPVHTGKVIYLTKGCKHQIIAESEIQLIEVQMGRDINVEDKILHKRE